MQKVIEEFAIGLLAKVYMVDSNTARDAWKMIDKVVRICLKKHKGNDTPNDIGAVKKHILTRLITEAENPTYYDDVERASVQTLIVVMARETTLHYVRNAHYAHSTLADVFKAMNVDVTGAESYLDGLDQLFTSSQKCVLRLIYGEGCSVMQAAGMLGVSPQEVRTIQWQAMELLQHEWLALRKGGAC